MTLGVSLADPGARIHEMNGGCPVILCCRAGHDACMMAVVPMLIASTLLV